MTNYGFVIDNRKCIGCHACTTACKSENEVPLSVNRTWVKYVETGQYPDATRHFQVTRCNHCANPPCVRICPVEAMYQRDDGIVEFDPSICIGCKACMQACPYDAIYIDPEDGTAAKCTYCAHRTDIGLEPACVVVCPEHAIIAGDMDDPTSEISHILAHEKVTVRKPEQGTSPKLFYIEGNEVSLHPTATERTPETYMWADVIPLHNIPVNGSHATAQATVQSATKNIAKSGATLRAPQTQGHPTGGPIKFADGRMADHMIQVAYNQQHKVPWHWPVPAYLVTKGIGSGIFTILSLGLGLGLFAFDADTFAIGGFLSLLFIVITTGLLIFDLERPERFFSILYRPQWRSWLTRGAYILVGFSILTTLWWLGEVGARYDIISASLVDSIRPFALWLGLPLSIGVAIYTAFLFGQAEGRDLWQSTLLPFHLFVQSLMAGSGALLMVDAVIALPDDMLSVLKILFAASLIIDLLVTLMGEFGMPHASEVAAKAAHDISHGNYKGYFWIGSMLIGHIVPLALLLIATSFAVAIAGLLAIVGLYAFEYAFVMAPQDVPNS
ncbi:MAG: NrfD/PsrC family molybdoenzyme membrane anchor subunit [Anaerolineae bacterium]|nr:NrfD/PsrC family molybdoenzyme membrane anchor subunit [Anaerolineae bacterium]MDQ7035198.1 NrfD/PsrC family molybdoenzyme membrane anchor subunit [Anaerolineae bacterium]